MGERGKFMEEERERVGRTTKLQGVCLLKGYNHFRRISCLLKGCIEGPLISIRGCHVEGFN